MSTVEITGTRLRVRLSRRERLVGLVRDQDVPLSAVRSVALVPDGPTAVRGLRSPGLSWPGHVKVGTYRGGGARVLVCVRRGQPAVSVELVGHRYTRLLVGSADAAELATLLAARTPDGVTERELGFGSSGFTLRGTLTFPENATTPGPAVLLLVGSGPVDRDSNHPRLRLDITRQLALALAAEGIASLRYDKRGVGDSDGGDWREVGFWDGANDARAALAALGAQPEVDRDRLAVVGHSEGALLATVLAGRGAPVCGAVLLAGSAVDGGSVLLWQARRLVATLPAPVRGLLRVLRVDPVAKVAANHARVRATSTPVARIGGVRVNAGWLREFMDYDPVADLAHVNVPLLAITGDKDLQVNPDDLSVIRDTAPGSTTIRMTDLTHTLRRTNRPASLRGYRHEVLEPVDAGLLRTVVAWTRETTTASATQPLPS